MRFKNLNRAISVLSMIFLVLSGSAVADSLVSGYEKPKRATLQLERMGKSTTVDALTALFLDESEDKKTRQLAAIALGESRDAQAFSTLQSVVLDTQSNMRVPAAQGLAELGDIRAVTTYENILVAQESSEMKLVALSGLRKIDTADATNAMIHGARSAQTDRSVRISLLEQLRNRRSPAVSELLLELSEDNDAEIRARAAIALSEQQGNSATALLVKASTDENVPHHVWSDVVARIETISGGEFSAGSVGEEASSGQISEVNRKIADWWASQEPSGD